MSSTTGACLKDNPLAFYETPSWAARVLLRNVYLPPGRWLDPCAGTGAIQRAVGDAVDDWTLVEIDPARAKESGAVVADFFEWHRWPQNFKRQWDVALFNPPFQLAERFVRACLNISQHVVCLQRAGWPHKRKALFDSFNPDIWGLSDRCAFGLGKNGKVGTDSSELNWYHFHPESTGRFRVMERVSRGEIKAANARIRSLAVRT